VFVAKASFISFSETHYLTHYRIVKVVLQRVGDTLGEATVFD